MERDLGLLPAAPYAGSLGHILASHRSSACSHELMRSKLRPSRRGSGIQQWYCITRLLRLPRPAVRVTVDLDVPARRTPTTLLVSDPMRDPSPTRYETSPIQPNESAFRSSRTSSRRFLPGNRPKVTGELPVEVRPRQTQGIRHRRPVTSALQGFSSSRGRPHAR